MSLPVSSSFHMTSMRVMTLRVWPLTDLKRCASSAIMAFHLMPTNTELSLSTVSYEVCTKETITIRNLSGGGKVSSQVCIAEAEGCQEDRQVKAPASSQENTGALSEVIGLKANTADYLVVKGARAHQQHVKLQGLVGPALVVEFMLADDLPVMLAPSVLQHILQAGSAV